MNIWPIRCIDESAPHSIGGTFRIKQHEERLLPSNFQHDQDQDHFFCSLHMLLCPPNVRLEARDGGDMMARPVGRDGSKPMLDGVAAFAPSRLG